MGIIKLTYKDVLLGCWLGMKNHYFWQVAFDLWGKIAWLKGLQPSTYPAGEPGGSLSSGGGLSWPRVSFPPHPVL